LPTIWELIGSPRAIRLNGPTNPGIAWRSAPKPVVRHISPFALRRFALTVLFLAVCCVASEAQSVLAPTTLVHQKAPEFVRTDLDNNRLDLSAYRGKVVLLNFWATWCAACQFEMPTFVVWQNKYRQHGLQIVGVSMDDDPALVREAYRNLKLNYPVAMGDVKLGDLYGGVLGLPMTFLIDRHGEVRAEFQGETDLNKIESQLQSLLPGR
jgi:cytochrome c biogenesis protein CcmG/thiol:disulfide interchange protein DsbE